MNSHLSFFFLLTSLVCLQLCVCQNICKTNPCLNGGKCQPDNSNSNGYTCNCAEFWKGVNCDQPINVCAQNPCLNSQDQCYNPLDNSFDLYACECNTKQCKDVLSTTCNFNQGGPCKLTSCADPTNPGYCVPQISDHVIFGKSFYMCTCENPIPQQTSCSSNTCVHGFCDPVDANNYNCICDDGFFDAKCDHSCGSNCNVCKNSVSCVVCQDNYILQNGICYPDCGAGQYYNIASKKCQKCNFSFYSLSTASVPDVWCAQNCLSSGLLNTCTNGDASQVCACQCTNTKNTVPGTQTTPYSQCIQN